MALGCPFDPENEDRQGQGAVIADRGADLFGRSDESALDPEVAAELVAKPDEELDMLFLFGRELRERRRPAPAAAALRLEAPLPLALAEGGGDLLYARSGVLADRA